MMISKPLVRTLYDMQHERIQTGNRICAGIKARMGQGPGMSEEDLDKKAQDYLKVARMEYARITDAFVLNQAHKYFKVDFSPYEVISDVGMLVFVELYVEQLDHEEKMALVIAKMIQQHPLWAAFLEGAKGCGPLMSAVILSEFDIHKARHVSSFWKYAGLDVVSDFFRQERYSDDAPEVLHDRHPRGYVTKGPSRVEAGDVFQLYSMGENGGAGELLGTYGLDMARPGQGVGRGRYAEHLVEYTYRNKDGELATRRGLTFNPFLKTKMVGVLASSFLKDVEYTPCDKVTYDATPEDRRKLKKDKTGKSIPCIITAEGKYRKVYGDYKHRLENHAKYGVHNDANRIAEAKKAGRKYAPKAHRHNMAMRYMMKMFLQDLWVAWRTLEGLPVTPPYAEAKLGYAPHGMVPAETA